MGVLPAAQAAGGECKHSEHAAEARAERRSEALTRWGKPEPFLAPTRRSRLERILTGRPPCHSGTPAEVRPTDTARGSGASASATPSHPVDYRNHESDYRYCSEETAIAGNDLQKPILNDLHFVFGSFFQKFAIDLFRQDKVAAGKLFLGLFEFDCEKYGGNNKRPQHKKKTDRQDEDQ